MGEKGNKEINAYLPNHTRGKQPDYTWLRHGPALQQQHTAWPPPHRCPPRPSHSHSRYPGSTDLLHPETVVVLVRQHLSFLLHSQLIFTWSHMSLQLEEHSNKQE